VTKSSGNVALPERIRGQDYLSSAIARSNQIQRGD